MPLRKTPISFLNSAPLTQSNHAFTYTSLKRLVFNPANEKWFESRRGSPQISNNSDKAPKPSTSVGSDPAFLSQSEQEIESVHWKLSWHFPPLLLPLSSWVRLPRELLWWLIDFNHITRLQKSGQRMKVLGNTTPWNPHTHLNIYFCNDACDAILLRWHRWCLWNCTCVLLQAKPAGPTKIPVGKNRV